MIVHTRVRGTKTAFVPFAPTVSQLCDAYAGEGISIKNAVELLQQGCMVERFLDEVRLGFQAFRGAPGYLEKRTVRISREFPPGTFLISV